MRMSDRPTAEAEVFVDAPPERVWEFVTDLDLLASWSSEYQGGEWLDRASGPALGARFRGRNRHDVIGEWESVSYVVEYEPHRVFAWAVSDPDNPAAVWRFELTPHERGTRVRQRAQMGPGPSGLTAAIERMPDKEERIIAQRLREHTANMTATLEGIKAVAEGGA